jgi:hypothetical protein
MFGYMPTLLYSSIMMSRSLIPQVGKVAYCTFFPETAECQFDIHLSKCQSVSPTFLKDLNHLPGCFPCSTRQ